MSGLHSRRKGHNYERFIAQQYRDIGMTAKRGWQTREGADDPDVIIEELPQYWIECGRKKPGCWVMDKYDQAVEAIGEKVRIPVVHVKKDQGDDLVVIPLHLWMCILKQLQSLPPEDAT